MNRLKILAASLLFAFGTVIVVAAPAVYAQYDPLAEACQGPAADSDACKGRSTENPISGTNGVILKVVNVLSMIIGIIAVIMIIIGSIKLTTSGGDAAGVKSAKSTIIYALVGVVVTLLARTIIVYVIERTRG